MVWTVDPSDIIFFGRLFLTGKVDLRKKVAVAGSEIKTPGYAEVLVGTPLSAFVADQLNTTEHVRVINGNPLTGTQASLASYVGGHTSEITDIPEGDDKDEMLGWILPRTDQFSTSRSYFSWLFGKKNPKACTVIYTLIALVFILMGTMMSNDLVWELTDMFNNLMVIPNVIALFALTKMVVGGVGSKIAQ